MTELRAKEWESRQFFDPVPVLIRLAEVSAAVAESDLPEIVRRLRTGPLKSQREAIDALVFAHGMATVCGAKVLVAPGESEDADFITKVVLKGTPYLTPVQLKELVPEDLNPTATLDDLISKVSGRPPSDTVLAIKLNRRGQFPLEDLATTRLPFAEVWYFWAADPSATEWCIFGDAMSVPQLHKYFYPS